MFIYNLYGRRISLEEASNLQKSKYDQYFHHRISSSKSNIDVKHSNLQVNSPWDYELQRFLIQGGRQLLTPKRSFHCKRDIQSAGSRLLQEYKIKQSEYEQDMEQKHDTSHHVNKPANDDDDGNGDVDGDDEVWNIEFNGKDYSSKKHSLSADVNTLHRKDNMKSYNLRITLNDIIQKIEDNQGMNIDTFNYLNDDNKLNKSKEDIRSSSPLSNSTSSCHALLHSSLHTKTSPTSSSSSSTPTFPSSSFNEIPNDSNDEIDIKDNMKSYNLRITLNDIIQKIEDNQGMNIDTFNYLNDDNKLNKSKEDIRSSSPLSNSTSSCHALLHSSLHTKTSPTSSSSSSTPTFPSSSFNEIPNDSNDEIDIPIQELKDAKLRSKSAQTFVELQKNIEINREKYLTYDAVKILTLPSKYRTESMIHSATVSVIATTEAFSEFPIAMQKAIIEKAWYEKYEARRMIIRQGQPPLNFYFIISGSVMSHDEFNKIFMQNTQHHEAEHITFLRTIPLIPNQIELLEDELMYPDLDKSSYHPDPTERLDELLSRRNVTICIDSNQSNWIYIIKTGQCRILKDVELKPKHLKSTVKTHRPKTEFQYYFNSSKHHEKSKDPYWSPVDIQLACHAIGKLGRDYEGIAECLLNKTPSMVATLIETHGQHLNLNQLASMAPIIIL
ncbi:uncharacterized protein DC041_0005608 [Schistosoma bovis]|uniref:Cyclic nucleotide-binding domain-containing protein n=1 Tax=Schistosoma bovis TaxID=6184 RepID=A0A430Q662_SCHBO|nr:uncharacterized protein DC041_0005608 [Schistosoma bovis]